MHIYPGPPEAKVRELLAACSLPTSDLQAARFEHFFGCGRNDEPKGVIGVELHGTVGLLRSLAVDEATRGRGCGRRLVAEAEQYAARNGVQSLYLLTTTAEVFFGRLGYLRIDRASVPEAIRQTSEFSALCPSTSAVMMKALGG
jgi:amino-acid N-acetyltransferase